mmetsp:Transcript_52615/g.107280  ORF Transcript_52615/g.107280 Transcript_52615/m.107280 type:complete len:208 (-) Transcript_52615:553-1176(-)
MELSNCAEMRCTSTCAVMLGESCAVARISSCAIWSFLLVPFFPRIDWISSILFFTLSSVRTSCSFTCSFGLSSSSAFFPGSLRTLVPPTFFPTFSNPSSSLSSPVFIHLLMPVAPALPPAPPSLDEEEESSFDQSESSSSSEPSSSDPFAFFASFFFGFSSSSSLSSDSLSSSSSLSSPLSSAPPSAASSSSSPSGFLLYSSISFSY